MSKTNQLIPTKILFFLGIGLITIVLILNITNGSMTLPSITIPELGNPFSFIEPEGKINIEPYTGKSLQCQKAYLLGPNEWYKKNCM